MLLFDIKDNRHVILKDRALKCELCRNFLFVGARSSFRRVSMWQTLVYVLNTAKWGKKARHILFLPSSPTITLHFFGGKVVRVSPRQSYSRSIRAKAVNNFLAKKIVIIVRTR